MRFVPVRRPRRDEEQDGAAFLAERERERGYLFDTDVVAALLRRAPDTALVRRVATVPARAQFISAITLGELLSGLPVEDQPELLTRLQELSRVVPVLPFDEAAARTMGQLRQKLGSRPGHGPSDRDLQVAAIALSNGLVLATADDAPYGELPGLTVERWAE
jgi:tRNA(fMet)-specific endonuclease VapC